MKKILNFIKTNKAELFLVVFLLIISGVAHGYNMFHFPYYENDEGTYISQAWSLVTQGKLAPYTYWYDHSPFGWMFLGLWSLLSGGFFTFGFSVNSGRFFMMLLHVGASLCTYLIGKKLTNSKLAGAVSVLIFSLSPLAIYFQRRVLLDNIMTFWFLISLTLLLYYKDKLRYIIFSAITFALAVLSKENAIFFIPAYLYILHVQTKKQHKIFAMILWIAIISIILSLYFIYALVKGEFFPSGTLLGGTHEHVSLLETIKYQSSRQGGGLNVETSYFWRYLKIWVSEDPTLLYFGVAGTVFNLIAGIKNKANRFIGILSASMWIFLGRGGLVIEFYILPLIPLLAIGIATTIKTVADYIKIYLGRFRISAYIPTIALSLMGIFFIVSSFYFANKIRGSFNIYTNDQTSPQIEAVNWILSRKSPEAFYIIDDYGYVDLHVKNNNNFANAEWYWKVDLDPEIERKAVVNGKNLIDYIATTPQMQHDIVEGGLQITGNSLKNSQLITRFWNDGWGVTIWGIKKPERILEASWKSYVARFIIDGRTIDPSDGNSTTSEGQSYSLLRSVWINDKKTFDAVLSWTKKNLQQDSSLFAWKYKDDQLVDKGYAADADEDIALSLLFAYKRWGDPVYLSEAKKIINGIWENEVGIVKGIPYITAGNWANTDRYLIINPSYLSPATYKIFAEVDTEHAWLGVASSSYILLNQCTDSSLDKKTGVLPPEWCALDKVTLQVNKPTDAFPNATEYSYNAFRTPWRVTLDYLWNGDKQALEYLKKLDFLSTEWNNNKKLSVAYTHDGKVWENYESVAAYAGDLGYFKVVDKKNEKNVYEEKILGKYYEDKDQAYWDDPKNYYTQNWAWFGTALYNDSLPNLWNTPNSR